MIYIIFSSFVLIILSILVNSNVNKFVNFQKEKFHIDNFGAYASVLEYTMNKSYDIIYKDRILIYSLEATKIDDKQFEEASKAFIILTTNMLGEKIKSYLMDLYGSDDRLYFIMAEYFNNRFENDEIRKESQRNLMERDDL